MVPKLKNSIKTEFKKKKDCILEKFLNFSLDWWGGGVVAGKDTPRRKFWLKCVNSKNKEEIFTSFQAERIKCLTKESKKIRVTSDFPCAQLKLEKKWNYIFI